MTQSANLPTNLSAAQAAKGARRSRGSGNLVQIGPNRWTIRVDYGRDRETGKRDRRSQVFEGTRTAAQKRMNELLAQRDQGLAPSADKILVSDWLRGWLVRHDAEGRLGEKSLDRYRAIIERHLIPTLGSMQLQEVRPHHVADLKQKWLASHRPATVHKHLVVLRQALQDGVTLNLIPRNPAAISSPSVTRGREEQRALSEGEIRQLLVTAGGTRYDIPIRFTLATGVREGELLALTWNDIDFDGMVVNLRGTKTANSRRSIELSPTIVQLLHAHRTRQKERRLRAGTTWTELNLVFPTSVGTRWLARPFYRDYRTLVGRTDIPDPHSLKWHTLRHTAASQWLLHGADIFSVSRRLGHASASFTMDTYAHLLKGQQKVAAQALDHLLSL